MKQHNKPEQRTYLQDRFEILIKKQKEGTASFNELTELDRIVNTYAAIREQIMHEVEGFDGPADDAVNEEIVLVQEKNRKSLMQLIRAFFDQLAALNIPSLAVVRKYRVNLI